MTTKQPDWERIEQLFRAGLLSVREIAAACGVSHTAINKRSKTEGWDRDLNAKIKAKADSLVSKREVSTKVSTETLATERGIVEANAEVIADISTKDGGISVDNIPGNSKYMACNSWSLIEQACFKRHPYRVAPGVSPCVRDGRYLAIL